MKIFINRWLLIILLALMVINIAVLSTIVFHTFRGNMHEREHRNWSHQHGTKDEMRQKLRHKLQSELAFDDLQMKEIEPILSNFEKKMDAQRDSLIKKRTAIMQLLSSSNIDTLQIEQTINNMGKIHVAMKMQSIRLYLQLQKHCNDSQREKLQDFFRHIMRFEAGGHRHGAPNDMPPPPPMPEFDKD